jgi:hypothetical protein
VAEGDEEEVAAFDEERYVARLDHGLFRLQLVDLALAYLYVSGIGEVRGRDCDP